MSDEVFDLLAGGDGDTLGVLRAGQRSKRILLVNELMATARARAPRVVSVAQADESFAVLADAQRHCRHVVEPLVLQPHVGAWATTALRNLLSDSPDSEAASVDLGHLGALAAVAAHRAGRPFDVTAYVSTDGSLALPTYGLARLARIRGWCRLRSGPDVAGIEVVTADDAEAEVVTADDAEAVGLGAYACADGSWLPLRRLRSSAGGVTLDVPLDDLDPYRGCGHLPTLDRLDAPAVADWQAKLDGAWSLLVNEHRTCAEALASGVLSLVPLQSPDGANELSASCHEAIGAVAMTYPRSSLNLALALVHEFQHTKLSALLDLIPLLHLPSEGLFYAPWRADPRPLRGLLQGIYAFLGLTRFWETYRRQRTAVATGPAVAEFEFALGRRQVATALDALEGSGQLQDAGARFAAGMRRRLAELADLSVPSLPERLAQLAYEDHLACWRLRNLRPDPEQVAAWAVAWVAGRRCPGRDRPESTLVDGDASIGANGRGALVRRRLADPERWQDDVEPATAADVLLVAGDPEPAAVAYQTQLAGDPDDVAAWAGLAVARRASRTGPGRLLSRQPEQVYALHHAIRDQSGVAPDPDQVAGWIGAGAAKPV